MLRITFEDDAAFAQPGPYRIKLFREPADRYLSTGSSLGYWNPSGEKLILKPASTGNGRRPTRLSALYLLVAPPRVGIRSPVLERLSGVEPFKTILSSSINTRLQSPRRLQRQFPFRGTLGEESAGVSINLPQQF